MKRKKNRTNLIPINPLIAKRNAARVKFQDTDKCFVCDNDNSIRKGSGNVSGYLNV
jgi:hypothetical protein